MSQPNINWVRLGNISFLNLGCLHSPFGHALERWKEERGEGGNFLRVSIYAYSDQDEECMDIYTWDKASIIKCFLILIHIFVRERESDREQEIKSKIVDAKKQVKRSYNI